MEKLRHASVDVDAFASEELLRRWCDRIGEAGLRGTASAAHERAIAWVEDELRKLPGLAIRSDEYEVLRWQAVPEGDLEAAGTLRVTTLAGATCEIAVAGAVPYALPAARQGELIYLPPGEAIAPENARSKVVLRDFPEIPLPYDAPLSNALRGAARWDATMQGG